MKSKIIAVAAAIVASASAAGAADLSKPAKVAVDYVKVCDAYGAGFFYIPGSDTCLKISGYVYTGFEYGTSNTVRNGVFSGTYIQGQRGKNSVGNYTRGDVRVDARTNTDYGLLRSYIDYHADLNTSNSNSATTTVRLDRALVQLGGLTAGRTLSNFDFYFSDTFAQNYGLVGPEAPINLLAYTFSFGNGITATLSLEDPTTAGFLNTGTAAGSTAYTMRHAGATFQYGGLNAPDVVANLNVTQAWGSAQLSAGAHQDYGSTAAQGTKWGFGVLGGVKVNVPQLGAGDTIGLQAAYSQGAVGFADWQTNYTYNGNSSTDLGADATWAAGTGIKQTTAWSIFGGFTHNFSPSLELDTAVGYLSERNSGTGSANGLAGSTNNAFAFGQTEFAVDLQWKPYKQVQISPYVEFRNVNFSSSTIANYTLLTRNATAVNYGLRVRRDF